MNDERRGDDQDHQDQDERRQDSGLRSADERNCAHLRHVMVWAMRNWARGAAGRINLQRELDAALSPVAARIAFSAVDAIMRLLVERSGRPVLVCPIPCRHLSTDERRMTSLCAALLAGHDDCVRRAAAELVPPSVLAALVDYVQIAVMAILDGNLPLRFTQTRRMPPRITIH